MSAAPERDFTFALNGQMPSGKGQIKTAKINGRMMRYPSPRFKAWRVDAFRQLQDQRARWPILREAARVFVRYTPGDLIRRDVPGIMDALCHLLEYCPVCKRKNKECGLPVVQDDSLLVDWAWERMALDRAQPKIVVTIQPQNTSKITDKLTRRAPRTISP